MTEEKIIKATNGYLIAVVLFIFAIAIVYGFTLKNPMVIIPLALLIIFALPGFF